MQTSRLQVPRPAIDPASDDRAWFLKDSRWEDPVWRFAPTNALEEELPVSLAWDFALQEGATSPTRATRRCDRPASNWSP